MNFIKKIIFPFFMCLIGLIIGVLWKDIPKIHFNSELKLYEILNLCITFGIGLFIPFLIKKWIDDNRAIKNIIAEELKSTISGISLIKVKISECYSSGNIVEADKKQINLLFYDCDLLIESLNTHLTKSLNLNVENILKQSKACYLNYWRYVTGGDLMNSSFQVIDSNFLREHNKLYKKLEDSIKTISHDVQKA